MQLRYPEFSGGANRPSLIEAQATFLRQAASDPRFRHHVRPPSDAESAEPGWRLLDPVRDAYEREVGRDPWPDDLTRLYWWRPHLLARAPLELELVVVVAQRRGLGAIEVVHVQRIVEFRGSRRRHSHRPSICSWSDSEICAHTRSRTTSMPALLACFAARTKLLSPAIMMIWFTWPLAARVAMCRARIASRGPSA